MFKIGDLIHYPEKLYSTYFFIFDKDNETYSYYIFTDDSDSGDSTTYLIKSIDICCEFSTNIFREENEN